MRKLNTIHIDSEMHWGGGQRQVAGLCLYLKEAGHKVRIICRPGSVIEQWASENCISTLFVNMSSSFSLPAVFKLRKLIMRESPDIVHLHAARAHSLGSMAAHFAGMENVVVTRRMDHPVRMVWPNTYAYGKWVRRVVAISGAVKDALIQSGVDESNITVIESGAEIGKYSGLVPDKDFRASLGISESTPVISTAATLGERKGIKYLLEAMATLKWKGIDAHVVVAGDGPMRQELESFARDQNLSVTFLGFFNEMPKLFSITDVFVMPSLMEGLGIAVLEAMAAGKPVVASGVGGLNETIIHGKTGLHVPPANSSEIAEAIEKILSNNQLAKEFGNAGRKRVVDKFSIDSMARRNESLYYDLAGV